MGRLLARSYQSLKGPAERRVFRAFGSFFGGGATVELLAEYLDLDPPAVERELNSLVDLSLVRWANGSSYYRMHDLTLSYTRALVATERAASPLSAIIAVKRLLAKRGRDYDFISVEMDNVLGAAQRSATEDVDSFLSIVGMVVTGGYLGARGHALPLIRLLDDAISLLDRTDRSDSALLHELLSKRGNAYYDMGDLHNALDVYKRALALAPSRERQAVLHAVVGKTLVRQGERALAKEQFEQAERIAMADDNEAAMLQVLDQQLVAAAHEKDFSTVRDRAERGLEISRRLKERRGDAAQFDLARRSEGYFLSNLGSAEFDLALQATLARHKQALDIAIETGDRSLSALVHHALGFDYHAMNHFSQAQAHLALALKYYREIAHGAKEAEVKTMMSTFGYPA